ncbi:hypothetical protein D3C87_1822760 [compost metagenome]
MQQRVEGEALALLAGSHEAQGVVIPRGHRRRLGGRDRRVRLPARLQRGVAAAMVRMEMGVDDLPQRPAIERRRDQGLGLGGVGQVAGVDERRVAGLVIDQQHVVGRQPTALEYADGGWQRGRES